MLVNITQKRICILAVPEVPIVRIVMIKHT